MISGIARVTRICYCQRIVEKINEFKDKSKNELEGIVSKQNPWKNLLRTLFVPYSNGDADYEAAKAVMNIGILGLKDFELDRQTLTVFGLYDKLYELKRDANKLKENKKARQCRLRLRI